jgi:hypothetical protein
MDGPSQSEIRELRLLIEQMRELIAHPAAYYDLYPRIHASIEVLLPRDDRIRAASRALQAVKGPDAQRADAQWRAAFAELAVSIDRLAEPG